MYKTVRYRIDEKRENWKLFIGYICLVVLLHTNANKTRLLMFTEFIFVLNFDNTGVCQSTFEYDIKWRNAEDNLLRHFCILVSLIPLLIRD